MAPSSVTIIAVVLNNRAGIDQTIRSVRSLNDKNIDLIVVDGGSTDGTIDVIHQHIDHIAHFISESDNGIYDAMNKGWAFAKEDSYVLFLGAGDKILSLPSDLWKYRKMDVLYGRVSLGGVRDFLPRSDFMIKIINTLHHQALLVRKSVHPEPPFNLRYKVYADFDFNQRLMKKGVHFIYSDSLYSFASTGGLSGVLFPREMARIAFRNFGAVWGGLSVLYSFSLKGYYLARTLLFHVLKMDKGRMLGR